MRILEEFWYGNIEPTEYDTSSNKEYKKLVELIFRNEEKLKATIVHFYCCIKIFTFRLVQVSSSFPRTFSLFTVH